MSHSLFAYGSLVFPDVLEAVTGIARVPRAAVLPGFARRVVRGRAYPAIVEDAAAQADGVVYHGLPDDALLRLDRFEGALYERWAVAPRCGGAATRAFAYVVPAERHGLVGDAPWDPDAFARDHLEEWVARLRADREAIATSLAPQRPREGRRG